MTHTPRDSSDPASTYVGAASAHLRATGDPGDAVARAQVYATLALVEEQRTANLIVLASVDASLGIDPTGTLRDVAARLSIDGAK